MNLTLFKKHDLSAVLDAQTEKIRQEVENYTEEYLLNASETDLVAHLLSKYVADPPQLGDPFMLEPREVDVDVGRDPIYGSFPGYSSIVKGCCVDVRIPFKGDQLLFFCRPSSYMTGSPAASVDSGYVMLEYRNPGELNPEEVKKRFDRDFLCISTQLNHIKLQCDSYNSQLESAIRQMVSGRKSRLLKNRQAGASIGLPLLRRSGAPQTYSIPNVQRKPEIQRPVVTTKGYLPEPALDEKEYEHIL